MYCRYMLDRHLASNHLQFTIFCRKPVFESMLELNRVNRDTSTIIRETHHIFQKKVKLNHRKSAKKRLVYLEKNPTLNIIRRSPSEVTTLRNRMVISHRRINRTSIRGDVFPGCDAHENGIVGGLTSAEYRTIGHDFGGGGGGGGGSGV